MRTEKIYGANRFEVCERTRLSARGIVVQEGKLLLVKNVKDDWYMIPGGGMETGETIEDCLVREMKEETGFDCKIISTSVKIEEYYEEMCFLGQYFVCEIVGNCERKLEDYEIDQGLCIVWMDLQEAFDMFKNYKKYDAVWQKSSLYLREYTGLRYSLNIE